MNWFCNFGDTIVGSMVFNIYFPVIMEFINLGMRSVKRLIDYVKRGEGTSTSTKTIQAYINLYSGPTYFLHYKYSSILNITFIAMMYGAGMPILFPVAAASLTTLYFLEKFMLYYVYQAPPAYDEKLNNAVLGLLTYAPLFLLSFGFWILSNKQINQNGHLLTIRGQDYAFDSEHYWYRSFTAHGLADSGPAQFLAYLLYIYFVYMLFGNLVVTTW
jgi:hypothetical protein